MQYYIPFEQAKSILNVQMGRLSGNEMIDPRNNQPITTLDQLNDFATYQNITVPGLTNPNYAFTVGGNWYIADINTRKIYQTAGQPTTIPVLPYNNGIAISMSGYGFDSSTASQTPDQILSTLAPAPAPVQTPPPAPVPTPVETPVTPPVQEPVVTPPPADPPVVTPPVQEPVLTPQTPPPTPIVTPTNQNKIFLSTGLENYFQGSAPGDVVLPDGSVYAVNPDGSLAQQKFGANAGNSAIFSQHTNWQLTPESYTAKFTPVAEPEQQVPPTPATPDPAPSPLTPQNPPPDPVPPAPAPASVSKPAPLTQLPTTASGPYPTILENLWYDANTRPLLASVLGANPNNSSMGAFWNALGNYGNRVGLPGLASGSNQVLPIQDKVLESLNYNLSQGTLGQNAVALPQSTPTTPPPATQTETVPPATTTTPPVTETVTPPQQTTTPTPTAPKYTPGPGEKYAIYPSFPGTPSAQFAGYFIYGDGTLTKPDGTIVPLDPNVTGTQDTLKTLYNGAVNGTTAQYGWTVGTSPGTAPTTTTTTPPPATTTPSNPLIPANQTPTQINANPLNMESILSASQGNLNWTLSNWNSQGSSFTQQPVLTVNGQNYTFNTPGEYINALSQIKNTGATGSLDQFISQFQAVTQYFPPTTTIGTVNTYNPQSYAPAPVNNSTNTGTNYNTNVDPNGTIAYNNTSTNTMNSIQPPSVQLQIGDTGDAVKQLQDFLVSKGFMTQAQVNTGYGNFGSQTQQAVSAFQQAYGVDTSAGGVGRYGPMTMSTAQSLATQQPAQNTNTQTNTNTNTQTGGVNLSTGNMGQVNPPPGTTQVGTAPINTTPTTQNPANTYNQPATTYNYPTVPLSPGQSGAEVQKLQNYLVQTGYMTQEQVNTGYGYYGTQTTEAVRRLQEDLGVDNSTGVGYWGPRTTTAVQTATANLQNNNTGTTPTNTGTTPTNTNTGTTPTTPIGSTTGNNTSTGITLQQFNSAMQDPVFTSWYANPENKTQFDALSFDQKSFLLLHTSSLSNTIQNGQVVNPNIQVTPSQLAMFYDQAKSELEPYYTDTYRTLANDVSQSLTRLKEDFDKTLARAVDPFKSALEKQAEDEAQSGTAFSSGRNKRESTMVTEQNNAISDVFQTAERSAQDLLRGYETKVGTNKASSLATPNLSLYNATNRGMTQSGSRTINPALIGGVTYGSIGADQTVSTKKRASEIEQVFRTDRALNNLTI